MHTQGELASMNDELKQVQAVIRVSLALQHGAEEGLRLAKQLQLEDKG